MCPRRSGSKPLAQSEQTTPHSTFSKFVTVTLAVHPLKGAQLPILAWIRRQDGRRYVEVEHPGGWNFWLPLEWTNFSIQTEPYCIHGQEVRLSPSGLIKLAAAICAAKSQKMTLMSIPKQACSMDLFDVSSTKNQPENSGHAVQRDRGVGNAHTQNDSRRVEREGEKS